MARPVRRARPARRRARPPGRPRSAEVPVVPGSLPTDAVSGPTRPEPPHAHAVCRSCGRIADVALTDADRATLLALADSHPDDWRVDGVTFSLTGLCPRCRAGRRA